jgi:hypothetical protein
MCLVHQPFSNELGQQSELVLGDRARARGYRHFAQRPHHRRRVPVVKVRARLTQIAQLGDAKCKTVPLVPGDLETAEIVVRRGARRSAAIDGVETVGAEQRWDMASRAAKLREKKHPADLGAAQGLVVSAGVAIVRRVARHDGADEAGDGACEILLRGER